ncbi:ABC transporter permease [Fictibacillus phosphorivorans]|uniref:ABC transporter permease n=1 Tax=Fictibacillus phosphorivorans TaxID=1221500 RepID=UPI00203C1BB6|nr:ABC transporter permease [Fictibacillus phosphorivorans]MCM3718325.1 ABC transporter permease [Fictibacillus phosphorivorans]MCM3775949.1 ABC transporter permease [Fictibacillus phosphorivorans]
MKWLSLLTNEWVKIFSRIRTWIFIALPILIILGVVVYDKVANDTEVNENWKQELTQTVEDDKKALAEAKKNDDNEIYIDMLETQIKQNEYAIENDISPNETTTWKFMKEMAPLSSLIGLFVIVVASDIVSSEFSKGTIKMLLIRPYSRWKILLSKFLATLGFAFVMWLVVIVTTWLIGGLAYGFGGIDQTYVVVNETQEVTERTFVEYVFANIGVEFIELTALVAMCFMISTLFMSNSVAIGVAMFTMFAGNTIVMLLASKDWIIYTLFANMDLSTLIDGQNKLIQDLTLPFSISMLAIYTAIMLAITFIVFQKRDVKA